ncbi:hypothetical protein ONZ51_g3496 [Trametes cubensis]|uniref:Uncharacterized protein n=1 Tax=Trametes cubensis TaxID=1111947 RepID=A0AAD7XB41_9APHY|nr:hypothetical protein ONZ51_g3496 [Trametes cubensis]
MTDVLPPVDPVLACPPCISEKPISLTPAAVDIPLATSEKSEPRVADNDAATFVVKLDVNDSDGGSDDGRISPTGSCKADSGSEAEVQIVGDISPSSESAHPLLVDVGCVEVGAGDQTDSLRTPVEVDVPPVTPSEPSVDCAPEPEAEREASKCEPAVATRSTEPDDYVDPFDFKGSDPYATIGLEPLDTFIPKTLYPDILIVHDPGDVTRHVTDKGIARYVRLFPAFSPKPTSAPKSVAHLYLEDHYLGSGNHSMVHRAPLTLRLDENSEERSRVRVAAKVADPVCGAHDMLRHEAEIYSEFPSDIQEDIVRVRDVPASPAQSAAEAKSDESSDSNAICAEEDAKAANTSEGDVQSAQSEPSPPLPGPNDANSDSEAKAPAESSQVADAEEKSSSVPVPSTEEDDPKGVIDGSTAPSTTSEDAAQRPVEYDVFPALVPKFFGFYAPATENGSPIYREHQYCGRDDTCPTTWPTHILLLEECGRPINPCYMSTEER